MTRKTTICATFVEKLAIKALLDERLHAVEGTDKFRYEDGWDDERVAKWVRDALSGKITAKIRNECFGKLHNCGKKSGRATTSLKVRLAVLEEQLKRLIVILALHHSMSFDHRVWIEGGEGGESE